jgi:hypothetical protein
MDVNNILSTHMRARKPVSYEGLEISIANETDTSFSATMQKEEIEIEETVVAEHVSRCA